MFHIKKDINKANISRTIRFSEPLFSRLNEVAHKNQISLNLLVLQCCSYALDNMDPEQEDSQK